MPKVSEEYYEKKRREIIDAAYRVCVRKPISSVEMKDIIAETGYSHGAIYRYYKDLDEVLHDLVITVNSENRIDEKLDTILREAGTEHWESALRKSCEMFAGHIREMGMDLLKLSIYSDMLAMSDPERVDRLMEKLGAEEKSPLITLAGAMGAYLMRVTAERKLKPMKSVEEILQFMIATYHGIINGYVLSECFQGETVKGKYDPKKMFSCLAESVILMMKG